jgi:hypothetical protein
MSWQASGYVKGLKRCPDGARLSSGQKLLALILADYHNPARRAAWPSIARLAEEALTSQSQIKRELNYLEEHLVIRRLRPEKMGRGWNCEYQFLELDAKEDLKALLANRSKGVHAGPLFCHEESSPEAAQKEPRSSPEAAQKGPRESNAIRKSKEHEQETKNGEQGAPEPTFETVSLELAKALIKQVHMVPYELPATPGNLCAVAEALKALIACGKRPPEALKYLLTVTIDGIQHGVPIDRFWFEDAKWKQQNGNFQVSDLAATVEIAKAKARLT